MSSIAPPNPYFSGINFNPKFFRSIYDYLTEQIADTLYLKLRGGSLSGNLGIKKSPANVELDIIGKANIGGLVGAPSNGLYGGNGTKLILLNGSSTSTPSAIGYNTNKLWIGSSGTDNISFYTGVTERMTIRNDGKVGIGTTDPNSSGVSTIFSDAYTQARLILSGREYYTGATTSSNGIALLLGVNRDNNKQLWIGDSQKLFINTTNSVLRFNVGGIGETAIDSYATDGVTPFKLGLNNSIFIKSDGNVGIGTTDASYKLQIRGATPNLLRVETNVNDVNQVSGIEFGIPAIGTNGSSKITSTSRGADISDLQFITSTGINGSTIRMTIKGDGNVGVGLVSPSYKLHVTAGKTTPSTAFAMKISGGAISDTGNNGTLIGLGSEDGSFTKCAIGHVRNDSDDRGDIVFLATNNTGSSSCSMSDEKMRITKFGNVGIGNNNPGNILQVGDGSRFRIANNSADISAIGTKEVDDVNNTSILMYGYTHANASRKGCVEYVASTATGTHDFFMNGSTTLAVSMTPDDFKITTSCSVYNNNYYTDGEYTTYQSRINALGTIKNGYFITTEYFFNSLVMCAFSHLDGSNNRYWFGHVGTSNLTTVIFIAALSSASMNAEPFIEQTTNKNYIYVYPTGTYSTGVNLRLKFYG